MNHVLVEKLVGLEAARGVFGATPDTTWHTSSAFVLEKLSSEGARVVSVERLVSQDELNRLGEIALEIVSGWAEALDTSELSRGCGIPLGRVVSPQLKLLLVILLTRAVIADRWIGETLGHYDANQWVVGTTDLSPVAVDFCRFRGSDALFTALLVRTGWKERINFLTVEASVPERNTTQARSQWRQLIERLLPAMNASWSKAAYAAWARYWRWPRFRFAWTTRTREVLIFGNNELIKESFLPLLLRGAQITRLTLPSPQRGDGIGTVSPHADPRLGDALRRVFMERLPEPTECLLAAASLAVDRLMAFFDLFVPYIGHARAALAPLGRRSAHSRVVLSHGLTDPVELLFYELVREARMPVIEVQHGGSAGLTHAHSGFIDLAEINACQASVVYNANFQDYYRRHLGARIPPTLVSGAPSVTRREAWPALSRRLARRFLKVGSRERVVMYVTNMFQGNSLNMPYGHLDTHYWELQREIVYVVFPKVEATCLIKLYPDDPLSDPHPLRASRGLSPNVRVITGWDFRYLRSGADVIVLDVPYGTLGWALGADVPTVLLDLPFNPLLPEVIPVVERALFRIDCTQPGWPEQLRGVLNTPHERLLVEWQSRAVEREAFIEKCLLGPPGSPGERIATFVPDFTSSVDSGPEETR